MCTESRTVPRFPGAELEIVDDGDDFQMYDPEEEDAWFRIALDHVEQVGELRE